MTPRHTGMDWGSAYRRAPVHAVLLLCVLLAGCSLVVGSSDDPKPSRREVPAAWLGVNGLLADPAAVDSSDDAEGEAADSADSGSSAPTEVHGDLMTTWALLHLSGGATSGIDRDVLLAQATSLAGDDAGHRLLVNAIARLLGSEPPFTISAGSVVLSDPAGPYNPFFLLIAEDAGAVESVKVTFDPPAADAPLAEVASWVITQRLNSGELAHLSDQRFADMHEAVEAADLQRVRALYQAALLASGSDAIVGSPVEGGYRGYPWLVDAGDGHDTPDLRASLLRDITTDLNDAA